MEIRTLRKPGELTLGSCSPGMRGSWAEPSTAATRSDPSTFRPASSSSTRKSDIRSQLLQRTMIRPGRCPSVMPPGSWEFRSPTTRSACASLSMQLVVSSTRRNACSSNWKKRRGTRLVAALVMFFVHFLFISMPADAALPPGQYSCNPETADWGWGDPGYPFLANSLSECLDKLRAHFDSTTINPCLVYASTTALGPPRLVATLWMTQDFFIIYGDNPACVPGPPQYRVYIKVGVLWWASSACSIRLRGPGGSNGALTDVEPGQAIDGLRAEVTCNGEPATKDVVLTVNSR